MVMEKKKGLYANIHAKRKRIKAGSGERMREKGSKGSPKDLDFKKSEKTAKKRVIIRKNRHVEKGTDDSGGKWKSVETKNRLKETYKKGGYKSKQVTDRKTGEIKSTVTKTPGGKEVEREGKKRYVRKENYRKEGVKTKLVIKKK